MKISTSVLFWPCVFSNFVYFANALKFPESDEQIEARYESNNPHINVDTKTKSDARMNLQNGRNDTQREREIIEYSAAANACQRYSKEVSEWTIDDGGETPNEFPWIAALGYVGRNHQIIFQCNGVIISEYFVLTAAQCVQVSRAPVTVVLGSSSLSADTAKDFPIKEIIQHPYYSLAWKRNDIALIRLAIRIHFTNSIRPACLETNTNDIDPTTLLTEIGWERKENQSAGLLRLNLQTMPLSQCNKTILDYNKRRNRREFRNGITRSQYCVYDSNSTKESCGILSGGPLQIFPPNAPLPNIVGLISIAVGNDCSDKHPEILTRVAYYIPWIEANVWPFDRRKVDVKVRNATNIVVTNSTENISLISASKNGYEPTVSLLIQNGANINEAYDGETALHVAAAAGQEKIARLLIHNGADYSVKNKQGKIASDIATENGFTKLIPVLQENVAQKACDKYSNLPFVTTRVLIGEPASEDEFPWMAALGYLNLDLKVNFRCGGTLISEKFVLTAAHCCKDNDRPVAVRLGQVYLYNPDDTTIVENHQIRDIINHPGYSYLRKTNDISLIELVRPVFFSESIRPACLQTYLSDENPDTNLTVAGWGIVSPKWGNTSNVLLKANLRTVPLSNCNTTIFNYAQSRGWTAFRNGIDQSYYCAADPNKMSDTCEGDSGGPLQIVRHHLDLSTVVGVVSTGLRCGTSFPGIYTRVAYFIDWIESYVWPNGIIATPLINQAV